jgi:hypothetical protein
MLIERHIFGSFKGYTTLSRSPGVSVDDGRVLEGLAYSFGQTYDARFNRTLSKVPAFFTRAMRGGRRALSRVLEGAPDDDNRPTLRVVTVIVSQQDWDAKLSGDVQLLLDESRLWQWDGQAQMPAMEVSFRPASHSASRKSVPRVLALLSEIERSLPAHRTVIVSADEFTQKDIACLEMLIPPSARPEFSLAYRTLSPQLQASVNCLAAEASSQDRVNFHYQPGLAGLSPYAEFLSGAGFAGGAIPFESINSYSRFGLPAVQALAGAQEQRANSVPLPAAQRRTYPWPTVAVALAAVILSVGAFVGAQMLSENHADELQAQIDSLRVANSKLAGKLADVGNAGVKCQTDIEDLGKSGVPQAVYASTARLQDELRKLEGKLRRQQQARGDYIIAEAGRFVRQARNEGAGGLNSVELRWAIAEMAGLDQDMLGPEKANDLSGRKVQIEELLQIVETCENINEWHKQIEGAKIKDLADRTLLANEIGTEAYQALGRLAAIKNDSKTEPAKIKDLDDINQRLIDVCTWVSRNGFAKSRPAAMTGPGK